MTLATVIFLIILGLAFGKFLSFFNGPSFSTLDNQLSVYNLKRTIIESLILEAYNANSFKDLSDPLETFKAIQICSFIPNQKLPNKDDFEIHKKSIIVYKKFIYDFICFFNNEIKDI